MYREPTRSCSICGVALAEDEGDVLADGIRCWKCTTALQVVEHEATTAALSAERARVEARDAAFPLSIYGGSFELLGAGVAGLFGASTIAIGLGLGAAGVLSLLTLKRESWWFALGANLALAVGSAVLYPYLLLLVAPILLGILTVRGRFFERL